MRAYLVDPEQLNIIEVEHDDTLQDIYKHIDASCIDAVRINAEGDTVYVDDEGLYNARHFWTYGDYPHPIAGKGLVLGANSEGESVDPVISIQELTDNVLFISPATAIAMAQFNDAQAEAQRLEYEKQGVGFIHVNTADIIKDGGYTDSSD